MPQLARGVRFVRRKELDMLLRITRDEQRSGRVTLRVEGRLVDPWAEILERECAAALEASRAVTVDLSGVTVIDRSGIAALGRLDRARIVIGGCSDLIASILAAEGIRATSASN